MAYLTKAKGGHLFWFQKEDQLQSQILVNVPLRVALSILFKDKDVFSTMDRNC